MDKTEVGKTFFDHVRRCYDTQYDYGTPEEAIAAFTQLALQEREKARATGDEDAYTFYNGFLKRCD